MTIRWIYQGEAGYWESAEQRFNIDPGGWRGGVTPDFFELHDAMSKVSTKHDSVGDAKRAALEILR